MSTRANIIVAQKGSNRIVQIYHHCDGYLAGVGEELRIIQIIAGYATKIYGMRPFAMASYMPSFMQVLASFGGPSFEVESFDPCYERIYDRIVKPTDDVRESKILTLSDKNRLHSDIEYLYLVWCDESGYDFYMINFHHCKTNVKRNRDLIYYEIIDIVRKEGVKLPVDECVALPYKDCLERNLLLKKAKELGISTEGLIDEDDDDDEDDDELDSGDDEVHVDMHFDSVFNKVVEIKYK